MLSILTSSAVAGVVAVGAALGWRRPVLRTGTAIIALAIGIVVAALGYRPVGMVLTGGFGVDPSLARILAYALLLVVGQSLMIVAVYWLIQLRKIPAALGQWGKPVGSVLGSVHALIIVAIGGWLVAAAPSTGWQRNAVTQAALMSPLITATRTMNQRIPLVPIQDLTDVAMLLTTDPESSKTVDLGFTTTRVEIDEPDEQRMLLLINNERAQAGLPPVHMNAAAQRAARAHSRDMFARGYFSHQTPEGADPFARMKQEGVRFVAAGENIALAPDLNTAHTGLMNSPHHRENIVSPQYRTVGIGIIASPAYGLMVTQDFTN